MTTCECKDVHHTRVVVLTGGPGAGKTAVLELIRRSLCDHVKIVPEAAGIVFGGGFPRLGHPGVRRAAQRAIFYVQRELEAAARTGAPAVLLCDRGTVDAAAYWIGPGDFWKGVGTTLDRQLARYDAVIHLRTPTDGDYNHQNPLRVESWADATAIDDRIVQAWAAHPRRFIVDADADFLEKAGRALTLVRDELPACCRRHAALPG